MRQPIAAPNIAGVLQQLDGIIADARAESSQLGYFPALYRRVTRRVAEGISSGFFDDGARMNRLDTNFANRYFAALNAHLIGRPVPKAWSVAFATTNDPDAIALQHLLLGINAHINVDLGAAVAQLSSGVSVRRDFDRIGAILTELTEQVQLELSEVSPRIADLDFLAGRLDEKLATFSIRAARDDAWLLSTTLTALPRLLRPTIERLSDQKAAFLGKVIAHPIPPARGVVAKVRRAEETDIRRVLDVLSRD
jgi:hypothetical protein